jgi:RimJ/RimL family protein N-acetyltransferase
VSAPVEVLRKALVDRGGPHLFSVRVLHEFGVTNGYLTPEKVRDLWVAFKDNPILFTDEVEGSFERFLRVLMDPQTVWFELFDEVTLETKGVYILTDIFPGYEATGHFAYWDRIAAGREKIVWEMMRIVFDKYSLNRMTTEIPAYQTGTLRSAEELGFIKEGLKRQACKRKGAWKDLVIMGILRSELEEKLNGPAERA